MIESEGKHLLPGRCYGHIHIESGMPTSAEFTAAVIPHGTTTMFTAPHEITNVLGLKGVTLMHDEALLQPVNIFTIAGHRADLFTKEGSGRAGGAEGG